MDGTLFRYWFFPAWWRRWSDGKKFSLSVVVLALFGGISLSPLLLLPTRIGRGYGGYLELVFGAIFLLAVNIGCTLAGATLITREKDRGAWEALQITPVGVGTVVRGKWLARTLLCAGWIGLFVPFWLLCTGIVLYLNDEERNAYYTATGTKPVWWTAARLGIYLL